MAYDNITLDREGSGMSGNYSYGYARVSTQQQDFSRQLDMLKQQLVLLPLLNSPRKTALTKWLDIQGLKS